MPTSCNNVFSSAPRCGSPTCSARRLLKHSRRVIGWFIGWRSRQEIRICDADRGCDLVFVDDAADAFLRAGASDAANGRVFGVGGADRSRIALVEQLTIDGAAPGRYRFVDWPPKSPGRHRQPADSSLIARTLGWRPAVGLRRAAARWRSAAAPATASPASAVARREGLPRGEHTLRRPERDRRGRDPRAIERDRRMVHPRSRSRPSADSRQRRAQACRRRGQRHRCIAWRCAPPA